MFEREEPSRQDRPGETEVDAGQSLAEAAYRRHGAAVLSFFRRQRGVRHEEAEDLAQETLLRAHRSGRLGAVENIRAYLLEAARNLLCDRARRSRLASMVPLEDADAVLLRDAAPSPESAAAAREEIMLVLETLRGQPPRVRQAVILHKFHQLPYAQVAAAMGISPRTVEKHLAKGVAACMAAARDWRGPATATVVQMGAATDHPASLVTRGSNP